MRRFTLLIAAAVVAQLACGSAGAQNFPTRPIRILVGFAPGGGADLSARTIAAKLSEKFGTPVTVENRPGAGGQIAMEAVVRSTPDGHTLLVSPNGPIVITPQLRKMPFDVNKDLMPVSMIAFSPIAIAVNAKQPMRNLSELVSASKAKMGGLSYSVPSIGTHMHVAGEMLKFMTGANLVPIPYPGAAPSVMALVAGNVEMSISDMATLLPQAKAGRIRILALTNSSRTTFAPDVPTVSELGFPDYRADGWNAIFAPAGTPEDILNRLNAAILEALALPDVRTLLISANLDPAPMKLDQMARFLAEDYKRWGDVIRRANLKVD